MATSKIKKVNMEQNKRYFTTKQKMAELLITSPRLLTLFERTGIRLGFGERSVEEVCADSDISAELFVALCNISTLDDFTPSVEGLGAADLRHVVGYLSLSHRYYTERYFPTLHDHIHLMAADLDNRQQQLINSFYDDYEAEVLKHFRYEDEVVFPYIEGLLSGTPAAYSIADFADNHSDIDEKLSDLLNIIIKYLPEPSPATASHDVLRDIFFIEEELAKHTLIENRLLVPLAAQIEGGTKL